MTNLRTREHTKSRGLRELAHTRFANLQLSKTKAVETFHQESETGCFKNRPLGGDNRDRTGNLRLAKPALSQLSYIPKLQSYFCASVVGLGRVELPTSRLSGVRSNQLSYRPSIQHGKTASWGRVLRTRRATSEKMREGPGMAPLVPHTRQQKCKRENSARGEPVSRPRVRASLTTEVLRDAHPTP